MRTPLSHIVKKEREDLGYTLRSFADKVDMSAAYLSQWETGKVNYDPSPGKIAKMEEVLSKEKGFFLMQATSGGSVVLSNVFEKNSASQELVQKFLIKAINEGIPKKDWVEILKITGK